MLVCEVLAGGGSSISGVIDLAVFLSLNFILPSDCLMMGISQT